MMKHVWLCLLLIIHHASLTGSTGSTVQVVVDGLADNDVDADAASSASHGDNEDTVVQVDNQSGGNGNGNDDDTANVPIIDDDDDDGSELDSVESTVAVAAAAAASRKLTNESTIAPPQQQQQQQEQPNAAFLRNASKGSPLPKKHHHHHRNNNLTGRQISVKALNKAIGGGVPGAIAGIVQVLSLMWLRTVINYQCRYGTSFIQALSTLYGMGGIPRLYSGLGFALIQAPLSRFVSTAANDGVAVLLQNMNWGPGREVVVAAFVVGLFRMMLMPIDTCKTVLQIESGKGLAQLLAKVRNGHVHLLYSGAFANAVASFLGHYPWFYTYNMLSRNELLTSSVPWVTVRNALIGFVSSIASDTVANFMRVIKTTKQALGSTRSRTSYAETVSLILAADGWRGLFIGRGLKTRILGNALQSILFTIVWRGLSERWSGSSRDAAATGGGGGGDGTSLSLTEVK